MSQRFDNRVVIITGAAGDIGRVTAARFAAEGASVVAVDYDAEALKTTVNDIKVQGGSAIAVTADVSVEEDVKAYVETARETFGTIDYLFNNAGIESQCTDISECDLEDFDRVFAVNVRGVLLGMKYVVPVLRTGGGGAVINAASVAGLSGAPGLTTYCASKHAVVGLTRSVAKEQGPNNIRVNAVCPSATNGRMMASIEGRMLPEDAAGAHTLVEGSIPMGRYAQPEEVASMVTYLCSDEAAFLTGGTYTVDGGVTA